MDTSRHANRDGITVEDFGNDELKRTIEHLRKLRFTDLHTIQSGAHRPYSYFAVMQDRVQCLEKLIAILQVEAQKRRKE